MAEEQPVRTPWVLLSALTLLGAFFVLSGVRAATPFQTVAIWSVVLLIWTSALPRMSSFRNVRVFIAAQALGPAVYFAASVPVVEHLLLIGNTRAQRQEFLGFFALAVTGGIVGLTLAWLIHATSRRRPGAVLGIATLALPLATVAFAALLFSVLGNAPNALERLRATPIVATLEPGEARVTVDGMTVVRARDGALAPLFPSEVARFPEDAQALYTFESMNAALDPRRGRVCGRLGDISERIEVRRFPGALLLVREGELAEDRWTYRGCAHRLSDGSRVPVRPSMLAHPMSATDLLAVLLAAALTALVQLPIAGFALYRYHRSRSAKAGTADGQGVVTLEDGSTVRAEAPAGPVLVVPGRTVESGYRAAAARGASLVASGSRAEIEARLRDDALLAVVAAHGALAVGIAPMVLLAWYGLRVPF